MHLTAVLFLIALLALTCVVFALGLDTAAPAEPDPSPAPELTPADADLVARALRARATAQTVRARLARVRVCLGSRLPIALAERPARCASSDDWERALRRWRHQATDWREKISAGLRTMKRPGGSGMARWWPLAKWAGWPDGMRGWFLRTGSRESGGCPGRQDYLGSGHWGLFQLGSHFWGGVTKIAGKPRRFDPRDPYQNLFWTIRIVRDYGTGPWGGGR